MSQIRENVGKMEWGHSGAANLQESHEFQEGCLLGQTEVENVGRIADKEEMCQSKHLRNEG
mgnify:CR=1 FL=1